MRIPANIRRFLVLSWLVAIFIGLPSTTLGVNSVEVMGLFKNQAVVRIDGKQRMLKVGKPSKDGVVLIDADSDSAVLEIAGQQRRYQLGTSVSTSYTKPVQTAVQIFRDGRGMYRTVGSINGLTVNFLVDTGATTIAMNEQQAKRIGLDYRVSGQPRYVSTASGIAQGFRIVLNSVKVGEIELLNVEAIVLSGSHPTSTLLGMSFLGRLQLTHEGDRLQLTKTH